MKILLFCAGLILLLFCCTKKTGLKPVAMGPELEITDKLLYDSCLKTNLLYYKNNPNNLLPGNNGPHGTFKMRFNAIAFKALTDNGELPEGGTMPEGSLIVKDVYLSGAIDVYALMYKRKGTWLWAEYGPNGELLYGLDRDPKGCTNCHSAAGNRDLVRSFFYY